ncbi:MAG: hypothetical protein F4169_09490 [Gammaproteobacteria bacterium]|nr:hypothetical protein [Gammaproteobacteria bacterium]
MSGTDQESPTAMPGSRGSDPPVAAAAVAEVLGNVRRLLREMETGPPFRGGWEYRFAALGAVVWPEGLDRRHLAEMGLATRTRKCLGDAGLLSGTGPVTTGDLLLPNFGAHSYRDLLAGAERFLDALVDDPAAYVPVAMDPELLELARRKGTEEPGRAERAKLASGLGSALAILRARVDGVVAGMTPGQRAAVDGRLLEEPRPTFAHIGGRLGVGASRAQQLYAAVAKRVRLATEVEGRFAATVLKGELGHVAEADSLGRILDAAVGGDGVAQRLLRNALFERMGYVAVRGAYLDEEAVALVGTVRSAAQAGADEAGLVDETELLALLPAGDWRRHWQALRSRAGLRAVHGRLAIRLDGTARAKAALLSLGRPAPTEAVAAVCGLSGTYAHDRLSKLHGVVRGTGGRWGLEAWLDGGFESIPAEIVRRIREGGGATPRARLLAELPGRFGVHVHTVRACLRAPMFVVRDGRVGLAEERPA